MTEQDYFSEWLRYEPDTGKLYWQKTASSRAVSGAEAGTLHKFGYVQVRLHGRNYKAHRIAWMLVHGHWPYPELDHKNRNRSDNRLCNLREATRSQNHMNKVSGKGVRFDTQRNRWVAYLAGKNLGRFPSYEAAVTVRDKEAVRRFGDFAWR